MKFTSACTVPSVGIVTTHNAIRVLSSSIKRKLRRRSAIEPVIGHKIDGHLGLGHFEGREGDAETSHSPPSATIFGAFSAEDSAAPDPDRSMAGIRRHPGNRKETARGLQAGGPSPIGDIPFTT